jgi:phage terminase small subunit
MKVNLKIKQDNTVETVQHEIEDANILQITQAVKVIKDIFVLAQENEQIQALIQELAGEAQNNLDESAEKLGMTMLKRAIGAMDVLLVEVPEKVLELLSALSDIEYDTLIKQKPDEVFDIYDAIIQVNDIEQLVKRAKKSLALTKAQEKVMNLFRSKKQTEQNQA